MNIKISQEVKEALASGKGVVALESTIISHGISSKRGNRIAC